VFLNLTLIAVEWFLNGPAALEEMEVIQKEKTYILLQLKPVKDTFTGEVSLK